MQQSEIGLHTFFNALGRMKAHRSGVAHLGSALAVLTLVAAQHRELPATAAAAATAEQQVGWGRLHVETPQIVEPKIVGGKAARYGRYPYIVSLRVGKAKSHFCGGSLIHSRLVLTAAHCFFEADGRRSSLAYWRPHVHIGGYSREGSSFKAQGIRTLVHRRYDPDTQENDVALVLLDRPSTQIPIRLPLGRPSPAVEPGTLLTAIGFGVLWDHGPPARFLQEVPLMLLSYDDCLAYMPTEQWGNNSMLCAGQPSRHKDTCTGDSGGPLLLKDQRGRPWLDTIVGITSFGYKCAGQRPGTYTNVALMAPWIRHTARRLLAPPQRGLRPLWGLLRVRQRNMTAEALP